MSKTVKLKMIKPKILKPKTVKPKTVKPKTVKPKAVKSKVANGTLPAAIGPAILERLWATVIDRRTADPAKSHSARLLSRGTAKVAQKFGEEAVECLIEAVAKNPTALVSESADVLYHLVVLWVASGIEPAEVWAELQRREGISGITEKAARPRGDTTKIP